MSFATQQHLLIPLKEILFHLKLLSKGDLGSSDSYQLVAEGYALSKMLPDSD